MRFLQFADAGVGDSGAPEAQHFEVGHAAEVGQAVVADARFVEPEIAEGGEPLQVGEPGAGDSSAGEPEDLETRQSSQRRQAGVGDGGAVYVQSAKLRELTERDQAAIAETAVGDREPVQARQTFELLERAIGHVGLVEDQGVKMRELGESGHLGVGRGPGEDHERDAPEVVDTEELGQPAWPPDRSALARVAAVGVLPVVLDAPAGAQDGGDRGALGVGGVDEPAEPDRQGDDQEDQGAQAEPADNGAMRGGEARLASDRAVSPVSNAVSVFSTSGGGQSPLMIHRGQCHCAARHSGRSPACSAGIARALHAQCAGPMMVGLAAKSGTVPSS